MSKNVKDKKMPFQLSVRRCISDGFDEVVEITGLDRNDLGEEALKGIIEKYDPKYLYNDVVRQIDVLESKKRELEAKTKAGEENDKKQAEDYINKIFIGNKYTEPDADYCITLKWLGTIHNGLQGYGMNADEAREYLVKKINELKSGAQRDRFKVAANEFWGSDEGIN